MLLPLFGRAQSKPDDPVQAANNRPGDEQLRERLRDYVARTAVLAALRDIEVAEIGAPDAHGIRKAVVRLKNSEPPITNLYYITADNGEVLRGPLEELSADPWRSMREMLAPLIADAPVVGPADAVVTLVEFADFQCSFCAQLNGELDELRGAYPKSLRWAFKSYPLPLQHPWSQEAALSGKCVAAQGATPFWKFQHFVFQHQQEIDVQDAARQLRSLALLSGATAASYDRCVQSPETAQQLQVEIAREGVLGLTATPTLFLNGRRLTGAISLESLRIAVDDELALTSVQAGRR